MSAFIELEGTQDAKWVNIANIQHIRESSGDTFVLMTSGTEYRVAGVPVAEVLGRIGRAGVMMVERFTKDFNS